MEKNTHNPIPIYTKGILVKEDGKFDSVAQLYSLNAICNGFIFEYEPDIDKES